MALPINFFCRCVESRIPTPNVAQLEKKESFLRQRTTKSSERVQHQIYLHNSAIPNLHISYSPKEGEGRREDGSRRG